MSQTDLHNMLAGETVAAIVCPPIAAGGDFVNVMLLLESVILGVYLAAVRLGGDVPVWDVMSERIKERLAEQRLGPIEPAGRV